MAVELPPRRARCTVAWGLRSALAVALCAAPLLSVGCGSSNKPTDRLQLALALSPSPPTVGETDVALKILDQGASLEGARVRLEANMNHAGMKPAFATLREARPGDYRGKVDLSMAGDWVFLVEVEARDGARAERKFNISSVGVR